MSSAVEFFHQTLHDDWNGWKQPEHWEGAAPLACNFATSFQHGQPEWVRLHGLAQTLAGLANLDAVIGRRGLGSVSWIDYYAAVMTLEFCSGFHQAGRTVELIQNTDDASPDARIASVSRFVTTEFKALHEPAETEQWDNLYKYLMDTIGVRDLDLWLLEIYPTREALKQRDAFVERLITILEQQIREPQELPAGTGRAWFRENPEMIGGWHPPIRQVDDLTRLVRNITGKWYRQVRGSSGPVLSVVRTGMLASLDQRQVENTAAEIAKVLTETLPRVRPFSAMLIYEDLMWPPPTSTFVQTDTYRLALGSADGRSYRAALLVPNPHPREQMTDDELDTFVGPHMLW
jgi:hypothetical protein